MWVDVFWFIKTYKNLGWNFQRGLPRLWLECKSKLIVKKHWHITLYEIWGRCKNSTETGQLWGLAQLQLVQKKTWVGHFSRPDKEMDLAQTNALERRNKRLPTNITNPRMDLPPVWCEAIQQSCWIPSKVPGGPLSGHLGTLTAPLRPSAQGHSKELTSWKHGAWLRSYKALQRNDNGFQIERNRAGALIHAQSCPPKAKVHHKCIVKVSNVMRRHRCCSSKGCKRHWHSTGKCWLAKMATLTIKHLSRSVTWQTFLKHAHAPLQGNEAIQQLSRIALQFPCSTPSGEGLHVGPVNRKTTLECPKSQERAFPKHGRHSW